MVSKRTVQRRRRNSKLQKRRSLKRKNVKSRKVMRGGGKNLSSVKQGDEIIVTFERYVRDVVKSRKSPNFEKLSKYITQLSSYVAITLTVLKNDNGLLEFDKISLGHLLVNMKYEATMVKLVYGIYSDEEQAVKRVGFDNPNGEFFFMCTNKETSETYITQYNRYNNQVSIFGQEYDIYLEVVSVTVKDF